MVKRVAVIGAGASGIAALKCCLDEGFDAVCLEQTNDIGGLWNFTENAREGQACVMKTTVINTSKEIMTYSDYPIPKDFPNFMHNTKVLEYFKMFANHFKLNDHIRFGVDVVQLRQNPNFRETGCWDIEMRDPSSEGTKTETFDAVLVCTGHHSEKNMPSFPGAEDFQGQFVHTHDYKDHRGYEDKRVVVVGVGNSGADVAVELSKIAKQVFLSTRRGTWVFNRVGFNGTPYDIQGLSRAVMTVTGWMPYNMCNSLIESEINKRFHHGKYGLKPAHRIQSGHPTVNDELPNRILCGSVIVKPNIKNITRTGVEFDDGTTEDNVDVIIFATGYKFGFPYIDHPALEAKQNRVNLYRYMFPPDMDHHTLAVIGCIQPWGAIMPISELQSRLACRVFKKNVQLPSAEEMWSDIQKKQSDMAERYIESPRHTIQVDYIPYMDSLAVMAGCKPDLSHLWLNDPKLAYQVVFGPCTPYQYRLMGPGTWPGAREAIMTQMERVSHPLKTRQVADKDQESRGFMLEVLIILVMAWLVKLMIDWLV